MNENPYRSSTVPHTESKSNFGRIGCVVAVVLIVAFIVASLFAVKVDTQVQQMEIELKRAEQAAESASQQENPVIENSNDKSQ